MRPKNLSRRARAGILVFGIAAATLTVIAAPRINRASAAGTRPAFQMPFLCNTLWRIDTWGHSPAIDIVAEPQNLTGGSPVLASAAGTVKEASYDTGAGNYVLLSHGGGWYTVHIHLRDAPLVSAGQSVSMGTRLGYIGQSGDNASSDHLHYEQLIDANGDGHLEWGVAGGEDVPVTFNGVQYTGAGGEWRNVASRNGCGKTPPPTTPTTAPNPGPTKYYVDTYANAPVFATPTSTAQTGTLNAGTNYVYCKAEGRVIGDATTHNKYWLKTDPDTGPANQYVSAYYLSRWGNDEAKDNSGNVIPDCAQKNTKYFVDTYANAPVFASATSTTQTGTLNAGTNYVFCKVEGRVIGDTTTHNKYWLKTDPDTGPAKQFVSAYYLSRWGNDEARDNNGAVLPDC